MACKSFRCSSVSKLANVLHSLLLCSCGKNASERLPLHQASHTYGHDFGADLRLHDFIAVVRKHTCYIGAIDM